MSTRRRRATHAGSWYEGSSDKLSRSLASWISSASRHLSNSSRGNDMPVYASIGPHAGYSYSGKIAAYAYAGIDARRFSRVIVLGPSHHVYLQDICAVSCAHSLETPLGDLRVDREVVDGLLENAQDSGGARFVKMGFDMDEAEHSIEMHLPFIKYVFRDADVKVVPIVVGSLSEEKEKQFGRVLSSWIGDGETFWVVSSDFCHWGWRFRYTRLDRRSEYIWQSIERLDREGMSIIESGDHSAFCSYIRRTENTVCGRHAIGILMCALKYCERHSDRLFTTRFVKYDQSSKCVTLTDSSVSYASAVVKTQGTPTRGHGRRY